MKITAKTSAGVTIEKVVSARTISIGRSAKCDVVVPDDALSRSHALFELVDESFFVTDLGSVNGVYIDGVRISANTKTSFNSFNQIHVGTVECIIEDNEFEAVTNPNIKLSTPVYRTNEATSATRMMTPKAVAKGIKAGHAQNRKKVQRKELNLRLVAPFLFLAAVGYYFYNSDTQKVKTVIATAPLKTTVPAYKTEIEKLKTTPNDFLLPSEYGQLDKIKTCSGLEDLCQDLKLDQTLFEGIAINKEDYLVFINPSVHMDTERYLKLKDEPEAQDLIAMDLILGSQIMNQYFSGIIPQIHLILNDSTGKVLKSFVSIHLDLSLVRFRESN